MLLHQTYIQAKTNTKQKILTITKCDLKHLQYSEAPTPRDPFCNLKAINSLGTTLAWWAHNILDINKTRENIAQAYTHAQRCMINAWS